MKMTRMIELVLCGYVHKRNVQIVYLRLYYLLLSGKVASSHRKTVQQSTQWQVAGASHPILVAYLFPRKPRSAGVRVPHWGWWVLLVGGLIFLQIYHAYILPAVPHGPTWCSHLMR